MLKYRRSIHPNLMPGAEPLFVQGNKTGVLLLHGFTGSPHDMKNIALALQPLGYTIHAPLLRGHGTTEADLAKCTWYDWFSDVKTALFNLRKKCSSVVAVGFSTGGTLALHLAAHYQLDGVVALAPGLILKQKRTRLLPYIPPFFRYKKKRGGPDIFDENARKEYLSYPKTPIRAAKELLNLYEHVKKDLPDIYVPVLLMHSEQDHIMDIRSCEYIYDHISSEQRQFLRLERSYHVLTFDVEKEIVIREILAFLEHFGLSHTRISSP